MKKLRLKALELGAIEILTREELRKEIGGGYDGSSGLGGGCGHHISCSGKAESSDCGSTSICTCEYVEGGGHVLYCRQEG